MVSVRLVDLKCEIELEAAAGILPVGSEPVALWPKRGMGILPMFARLPAFNRTLRYTGWEARATGHIAAGSRVRARPWKSWTYSATIEGTRATLTSAGYRDGDAG